MNIKLNRKTRLFRVSNKKGRKCVWVISFTPVASEPRVLRQTRALFDAGWEVVVIGYEGHSKIPKEWNFIRLIQNKNPYIRYILGVHYVLGVIICKFASSTFLKSWGIRLHTLSLPNWRNHYFDVLKIAKDNPELNADLVISHDYFTSMLGDKLAELFNAKFTIDSHEYAREQYMHDRKWVQRHRPYVIAAQDYYFSRADVVTTVCDGIANLLNSEQELKRPVVTVRSVPFKALQAFREVGNNIIVLYHGNITHARGLHKAIESMPHWREEFNLIIRGSGDDEYIEYLLALSKKFGLHNRVKIEPPVPFDQIIPCANNADIGYFVHENISKQKQFTLPNKFFEYVMSGLALCVSDLPEMKNLTKKYKLGKLVNNYDIKSIANTINSFNKENIETYKKASILAAKELNWDIEKKVMLDSYENILQ